MQLARVESRGMMIEILLSEAPIDGIGVSTHLRPGRSRTRSKEKGTEKAKTVPGDKKNAPSSRKAPSRGRYVDEYAQPPGT